MEELVILDHSNSSVHFYKVDKDADLDYDFIEKLGFNPEECSWMYAEDIDVFKHKGIIKWVVDILIITNGKYLK